MGANLTLYADRQAIAPLLRDHSPEDALAAYYALHHSEIRTKLTVHRDERGHALGFMAVCQTGFDLFQPLAVLRAPTANGAEWLPGYCVTDFRRPGRITSSFRRLLRPPSKRR